MIDYLKRQTRKGRSNSQHHSSSNSGFVYSLPINYVDEEMEIFGHRRAISKVVLKNFPYGVPWVIDDAVSGCMLCLTPFTFFKWRHHCRVCGHLICDNCSSMRIHLEVLQEPGGSRLCDFCVEHVVPWHSNIQNSNNNDNNNNIPVVSQPQPELIQSVVQGTQVQEETSALTVTVMTNQVEEMMKPTELTSAALSKHTMTHDNTNPSMELSAKKPILHKNTILGQTPSKHICHISKFEEAAENGVWEVNSSTPASSIGTATVTPNSVGSDIREFVTERKAAVRLAKADASVAKAIRHCGMWEAEDDTDDNVSSVSEALTSMTTTPYSKSSKSFGQSTMNGKEWDATKENSNVQLQFSQPRSVRKQNNQL